MALGTDLIRIRNLVLGKGMLTAGLGVIIGPGAAAFMVWILAHRTARLEPVDALRIK